MSLADATDAAIAALRDLEAAAGSAPTDNATQFRQARAFLAISRLTIGQLQLHRDAPFFVPASDAGRRSPQIETADAPLRSAIFEGKK